jgi:CxxC-x17-CxxC domain-containing protein
LSNFTDKTLTCRDCGTSFVFSASEQEFFAEKGFTNEPGRCPECRAASKARRNGGFAYSTGGGGGSYDRPQRQMYPAVCATCGKATQVPFEPRLDRPVYCSDCYTPRQSSGGSSYGRRPGGNSGGGGGRRSY